MLNVPLGMRCPRAACPYKGILPSPTCFSSHVSCFWSRALFLSRKRCLAAVIESSEFRFEILTISAEESEKENEEAIDLNENNTSTADRDKLAQRVETNLFGADHGHVTSLHDRYLLASLQPNLIMNNCLLHVTWAGGLLPNHILSTMQQWVEKNEDM